MTLIGVLKTQLITILVSHIMNSEKYDLKSESDFTVFEFISQGTNGRIEKVIHFQKLDQQNLYNLAFGDRTSDFLHL